MHSFRIFMPSLIFIGFIQTVTPAAAEDPMVEVTLAGEAYQGPPTFEIDFAGTKIGVGAVDKAIDTTTEGRIQKLKDWAPYTQTLSFPIPADVFTADGAVSIRLTNDAWGGPGSNQDRNIYLMGAKIDGVEMSPQDFVWLVKGEESSIGATAKWVSLSSNNAVAVANPPSGGWPSTNTGAATPVASAETAQAAAPGSATAACNTTLSVTITGYGSNQIAVPAGGKALKELADKLKDQSCAITITGYSSISGPTAFNKSLSGKRAEGAAAYLKKAGVDMSKAKTMSGGETSQFGKRFAANRRVVVDVAPAK
ncbi:OmpA family protein [Roseibium sp.]|uniref:OmpA family protein n=1 Tax=Roseibium sp. TaxID=1936156 RepID=UPI003A97244D